MVQLPPGAGPADLSAPAATATAAETGRVAAELRVRGLVQGVGFRPFVHRLAVRHGLAGYVRNAAGDVQIVIEGPAEAVDAFAAALPAEAPVLARLEGVERTPRPAEGRHGFAILASTVPGDERQPVSPDVAMCHACARELHDPADRRYRYPFITCTDCGPRFSLIEAMPYDRERTSMRAFAPCPACLEEYRASGDRRFHSQTNSCPACGPHLWLTGPDGRVIEEDRTRAIQSAAMALRAGLILAVRGLGGFHLAVDATDQEAVTRLRVRKQREAKPLAVMVRTLEDARAIAFVSVPDAELLDTPERPIVLLRRRDDGPLAPAVAPHLTDVGVMLAYTPLHDLLLDAVGRPLVMTSGNRSEEPIAIGNDEAVRRLEGIADVFLLHDREIVARYDDSVVRRRGESLLVLRRARGFAPMPVSLPVPAPKPLVAVGPHLKNTLTLAAGDRAWVSQHIGELESLESLDHFRAVLEAFRRLFRIEPEVAVRDLHGGYLSTRVAAELGLPRTIIVQHHHAHIAAVMAEHGVSDPVVGLALDGTGAGDDHTAWGAEALLCDLVAYRRRGHLRTIPLPGGDLASRQPWRSALGWASLDDAAATHLSQAFTRVTPKLRAVAASQIDRGVNTPRASSMGRLFDAAAALLGVRGEADYEGQAAMELEALAGRRVARALPLPVVESGGVWVLDALPLLAELGRRRADGGDVDDLAAVFHESVAAASADLAAKVCEEQSLDVVALGGGCFQNLRLLDGVQRRLERRGLRVLVPRVLPPNDGGVSYGQAAVAAALLAREG